MKDDFSYLRNRRKKAILLAFAIVLLASALGFFVLIPSLFESIFTKSGPATYALIAAIIMGAAVPAVFGYLEPKGPATADLDRKFVVESIERMHAEIKRLSVHLQTIEQSMHGPTRDVSAVERSQLIETMHAKIRQESIEQFLVDTSNAVAAASMDRARELEIDVRMDASQQRLSAEILALSRRGNLNLVLGIFTAIVGLLILAYSVFGFTTPNLDPLGVLVAYLPRLSLVVLIEVFSYFFLRLYKTTLNEIKYFQNELTNLESKQLALRVAQQSGDMSALASLLQSLGATERNHILLKGETTVELEKVKHESTAQNDFIKFASKIILKNNKD